MSQTPTKLIQVRRALLYRISRETTKPDEQPKRRRGRPVEREMPQPILDTPEGIVQAVLRTRPQAEIDCINTMPQ